MGYYSDFTITLTKRNGESFTKDEKNDYIEKIHQMDTDAEDIGYGNKEITLAYYDAKWYDYCLDMEKFTLDNPEIEVRVIREGEESGDVENIVFSGGKIVERTEDATVSVITVSEQKRIYVALISKDDAGDYKTEIKSITEEEYNRMFPEWERDGVQLFVISDLKVFGTELMNNSENDSGNDSEEKIEE